MPKRHVSEDCYSPMQRKIRIGQKEIDRGSHQNMNKVYQNTLSLLFSGAKNSSTIPIAMAAEVPEVKASEISACRTLDSWVNVQSSSKEMEKSSNFGGGSSYMDSQPGPSGVQNGFCHNGNGLGHSGIPNGINPMDSQPGPSGVQNGVCYNSNQPGPSGIPNGITPMDSQPGPSGIKSSIRQQKSLTSFFHVQSRQRASGSFQNEPLPQNSHNGLFNGNNIQEAPQFGSPVAGPSRSFASSSRNQGPSSSAGGSSNAGPSTSRLKMFGLVKDKANSNNVESDVPMEECVSESKSQCSVCRRDVGSFTTRCDYCDSGACHSCLVQCSLCQGSFCNKCALPDYEADSDTTKCLSCFN